MSEATVTSADAGGALPAGDLLAAATPAEGLWGSRRGDAGGDSQARAQGNTQGQSQNPSQSPSQAQGGAASPALDAAAVAQQLVPEKYEFAMPEGVVLDTALQEQFTPVLKDLRLNNSDAQKLVDAYTTMRTQEAVRMEADLHAQVEGWKRSAIADREIGGREFQANVTAARTALAKFGTPELTKFLNLTGMANHPELVRVFARIGKSIGPDSFVREQPYGATTRPIEERLYSNNRS